MTFENPFFSQLWSYFCQRQKNKIRKNEFKDNNYFSLKRFDHQVSLHKSLKARGPILDRPDAGC